MNDSGETPFRVVPFVPLAHDAKAHMVELLEETLEAIKANKIESLVLIPVLRDGSWSTQVRGDISQSSLVGMLEFAKFDLLVSAEIK